MALNFRNLLAYEYRKSISESFNLLVDYFNFEPGEIFIEVLPLDEFEKFYNFEYGGKSEDFIVGSTLNNGRILILDKKDFPLKKHMENEFEEVILHELCHMFIRRLTDPEHAYIWIQEGICEYLSFGKNGFKVKNNVDFRQVETEEGWDRYNPYQQAGAFFKYLSKNQGDSKIVEFIKGIKQNSQRQKEFFKEVFGKELGEIQENFFNTLKNEKNI